MKILVTGGAGFIGSHLVDRLVQNSAGDVVVIDNFSRGRLEYLTQSLQHIEIVKGDIRDRVLLTKLMSSVDLVFHLAAQSNVLGAIRDLDYSFETNVVGTYEVLKASWEAGVKRVIFTSSREVYGERPSLPVSETSPIAPINAYGASKVAGEMYCRSFAALGLEVVIFRLSNVYGTRDQERVIPLFARKAVNGEDLTVFGGEKELDFLWIDDLVDVFLKASRNPCPEWPINIGSGRGTTLLELAGRICSLTDSKSTVKVSENRRSEVSRFVADVSNAKRLFGLRCPEDPMAGLPRILEALRLEVALAST